MRSSVWFALLFSGIVIAAGCTKQEEKTIRLGNGGAESGQPEPVQKEETVRIAVGGMITPKEGVAYYRDLLRYLQGRIGVKVEYVDRESYAEINDMLRTGKLEAAFVCSGPYVDGKKQFGLELLVAPQAYGRTVYYSYIIVPQASGAKAFPDLRGKRFAFTDPLSNTGRLVPTYMLAKMKETPDTFFREVVYTRSHDRAIRAVAQGIVDGAAVDSLIWDYLNAMSPELTGRTRILARSEPYAIPPVAVPRSLPPRLKNRLRKAFLEAHLDPQGREILARIRIDRFVMIDDSAYDSVREMQAWIAKQNAAK